MNIGDACYSMHTDYNKHVFLRNYNLLIRSHWKWIYVYMLLVPNTETHVVFQTHFLSSSLSNIVFIQNVTNWRTLTVWKGLFGILFWYCAIFPSVFDILWGPLNLMCFLCTVRSTILGTDRGTVVSDKKRDRRQGRMEKKKEIVIVKVN